MILSQEDLKIKYKEYSDVKGKVRREVAAGNFIPLMCGLCETDATVSGKYLAGHIYGPLIFLSTMRCLAIRLYRKRSSTLSLRQLSKNQRQKPIKTISAHSFIRTYPKPFILSACLLKRRATIPI